VLPESRNICSRADVHCYPPNVSISAAKNRHGIAIAITHIRDNQQRRDSQLHISEATKNELFKRVIVQYSVGLEVIKKGGYRKFSSRQLTTRSPEFRRQK
jgi:hypothetical protein